MTRSRSTAERVRPMSECRFATWELDCICLMYSFAGMSERLHGESFPAAGLHGMFRPSVAVRMK